MYVEPNSHFWTDLSQILVAIEQCPEELTPEYLKIGLNNSKKNGCELKQVKNIDMKNYSFTIFTSIDDIINYVDFIHFNLFDLKSRIEDTLHFGLNLTNGIIMEREEIYTRIDGERDYQDANWGSRRQMDGTPDEEKPVAEWINYIEYHIGKAKEKVYHLDTEGATHELRKVAALAVRAMEIHGCPERIIKLDYNPDEVSGCSCTDCECKKGE
jgi:hypothetical protein